MAIEKRDEQAATTAIITPAKADEVLEMIKAFEYFKKKVLTANDKVDIQGKPFVKKSGWSKYALACNVSTEVSEERVEERDGNRIYHFTYRAIHIPSGRYAEAVGSASEAEKDNWNHPEHDVRTLAQTRAFNRCISNLVGGGELSAEEMGTPTSSQRERPRKTVKAEQKNRVGDPPRQMPKEEPEAAEGPPGSVEDLRERLSKHIIGLDDYLVISDRGDYFRVGRKKHLDDEIEYVINEMVTQMGGSWSPEGNDWRIPAEAKGDE